ncbi:MAG: hypothetical protein U1E63_01530 [Burkholderiales bacterium]
MLLACNAPELLAMVGPTRWPAQDAARPDLAAAFVSGASPAPITVRAALSISRLRQRRCPAKRPYCADLGDHRNRLRLLADARRCLPPRIAQVGAIWLSAAVRSAEVLLVNAGPVRALAFTALDPHRQGGSG